MKKSFRSQPFFRVNNQIRANSVRVLDEKGKQIGVMPLNNALKQAEVQELDLVEIAPHANPPVAKIIDYSKFLYQLKKKKKEEKKSTKTSETKEIRMKPFIDDHDLEIKLKKAKEFIMDGDKVRFVVRFPGRLITRKELGEVLLKKIIELMQEGAKVEKGMHMEGRQMVMMMVKVKHEGKHDDQESIKPEIETMEGGSV